jgi:hypothetical protein
LPNCDTYDATLPLSDRAETFIRDNLDYSLEVLFAVLI